MPAKPKVRRGRSHLEQARDEFMSYQHRVAVAVEAMLKASEVNRAKFLAAAEAWSLEQATIDERLAAALRR